MVLLLRVMVNAPQFPMDFILPYPFISSGDKINLVVENVIKFENKFSHLWLYE